MQMDGLHDTDADGRNRGTTVTDPALLALANAGADWFCAYCGAGNRGDGDRCAGLAGQGCGAARTETPPVPAEVGVDPDAQGMSAVLTRIPKDALAISAMASSFARRTGLALAGLVLLVGVAWFFFRTTPVDGTLVATDWTHNTHRQSWTQVTQRYWQHETPERAEIPPVDGRGERAGYAMAGGCADEVHHHVQVACGSHQECQDHYTTEFYSCGEVCSDNGNGFATCTPQTCSRQVYSHQTCRTVIDYCPEPVYETKCDYRTQKWKTVQTETTTGSGHLTTWPVLEPGVLDRIRFSSDYVGQVVYTFDGEEQRLWVPLVDGEGQVTRDRVDAWEEAFHTWSVGEPMVVRLRRSGKVTEVLRASDLEPRE